MPRVPHKEIKNKNNYTVSAPRHLKKWRNMSYKRKCTVSWPKGVF